jgi:IclR family acetate operon transcriptional repressor
MRALSVLRTVAAADQGLTLEEIAARAELPLTSAHRVVVALAEQLFITRSTTNRRYFIGPATRELCEQVATAESSPLSIHPAMEDAARSSQETVFLTELVDGRAVCVALVGAARPPRRFVRIGQETPLHAAASARVLLAELPDPEVRRLLARQPLTACTEETSAGVEAVREQLVLIRARGYDVGDDELGAGVWAVAAPVRSATGRIRASLTIAAVGVQLKDPPVRELLIDIAGRAAAELSADLGFEHALPLAPREDAQ